MLCCLLSGPGRLDTSEKGWWQQRSVSSGLQVTESILGIRGGGNASNAWLFLKGLAKFTASNAICHWAGVKGCEADWLVPASCLRALPFPLFLQPWWQQAQRQAGWEARGAAGRGGTPCCQQKHLCRTADSQKKPHCSEPKAARGGFTWVWVGGTWMWAKVPFHQRTWVFCFWP